MIYSVLKSSQRPVLIFGFGVRLAGAETHARLFAEAVGAPVVVTWGVRDLFPESFGACIGGFGTHGTRAANYTVQNADLIISVGARLDSKAMGTPPDLFAREARKIVVDIDPAELRKFGRQGIVVEGIQADALDFLNKAVVPHGLDFSEWRDRCMRWKEQYPPGPGQAYDVMRMISDACAPGDIIVSDTGCTLGWAMQAWRFKERQRFLHPFNQTPMGCGLPMAIGAHYATGKRIIYLAGDGSLMMAVGELATVAGHQLPIKTLVFNNRGHAMCRQTQREWLGGEYPATSVEGGLCFPKFWRMAAGFGLKSYGIAETWGLRNALRESFQNRMPVLYDIDIDPADDLKPKNKFGKPIEVMEPELSAEEHGRNMIVEVV